VLLLGGVDDALVMAVIGSITFTVAVHADIVSCAATLSSARRRPSELARSQKWERWLGGR
jgi:hypothetical protein